MNGLDLSGAYLLEPSSGMAQSQEITNFARAIAERYPNIRLCGVPAHERTKDELYPFALVDTNTGQVLKELKENELNINIVFRWLYEHDTALHGEKKLYDQYIADKKKKERDQQQVHNDNLSMKTDFINTMAKSVKHYYKHDGRKYGEF